MGKIKMVFYLIKESSKENPYKEKDNEYPNYPGPYSKPASFG